MFEYKKIKTELEEVKCPVHGKTATVSFDSGKMVIETACCEEHKALIKVLLTDVSQRNIADIIAEVF
jgi:hypothetical protein